MVIMHTIIEDLVKQGWSYQKNYFSTEFCHELRQAGSRRILKDASIGKGHANNLNQNIRNDKISWLNEEETEPSLITYQQQIDNIKQSLNENLYLGLKTFEAHFAKYDKGNFYKPHKDSFKNDNKRIVTLITYLNSNWSHEDGGQLRLHLDNNKIDIEPTEGSIICFLSEEILHEVLLSNKERNSITGWLLR